MKSHLLNKKNVFLNSKCVLFIFFWCSKYFMPLTNDHPSHMTVFMWQYLGSHNRGTTVSIFLHTCMMQCMRYMCMHVRSNMLCCPTFVDLTPKFGVHKYIYIHI